MFHFTPLSYERQRRVRLREQSYKAVAEVLVYEFKTKSSGVVSYCYLASDGCL